MSQELPVRRSSPMVRVYGTPRRRRLRLPQTSRRRFLPAFDRIEDRMLLSTLTVTNANDGGPGSLRAAIAAASGGDTIAFDRHLRGSTIHLTGGELAINRSLGIEGPGSSRLTVDGGGNGRVFHVTAPGVHVTIAGLTIRGGQATMGGAVLDEGASLSMVNDVMASNEAIPVNASTTAAGGAVAVTGAGASLSVDGSILTGNLRLRGLPIKAVGLKPSPTRWAAQPPVARSSRERGQFSRSRIAPSRVIRPSAARGVQGGRISPMGWAARPTAAPSP